MSKPFLKHIIVLLFLLCPFANSFGQKKLLKKFLSNEKDTTRSSSFLPLPAAGYSQETGIEVGLVPLYSFYTDRQDTTVRSSSITGVATITTKKQLNLHLKSDIWSPGNKYHYQGELRYKYFPLNFYGIGSATRQADEQLITQKLVRLGADIEKKSGRLTYTGINLSFDQYRFNYGNSNPGMFNNSLGDFIFPNPNQDVEGKDGGKVLFAGISQILDSRNSNTYPTKGIYMRLNYSYAPDFFGKGNFNGSFVKFDFRGFKSLNSKLMLGLNANYQTLQGKSLPFYLLPQLGNDQMMRGYYSGRYRDQNLMAAQAELRYRFNPRFGLVGFVGTGAVYQNGSGGVFKNDTGRQLMLSQFKPSYGGGFRYFFDVERGLSVRMDYGIGEKRPGEKRQTGVYFGLGESF
ncbi:MAG TPA: polymerase [Daejeonella sp.]|nr:polymerase [Daejeonella sp.]